MNICVLVGFGASTQELIMGLPVVVSVVFVKVGRRDEHNLETRYSESVWLKLWAEKASLYHSDELEMCVLSDSM